jgi:hypothetical protein
VFWRSMASVYWVRSLVPIEKKSQCRASTSACTAAAGTSIMMPSGTSGAPTSLRISSQISRSLSTSGTEVIIGIMIESGASLPLGASARTWSLAAR